MCSMAASVGTCLDEIWEWNQKCFLAFSKYLTYLANSFKLLLFFSCSNSINFHQTMIQSRKWHSWPSKCIATSLPGEQGQCHLPGPSSCSCSAWDLPCMNLEGLLHYCLSLACLALAGKCWGPQHSHGAAWLPCHTPATSQECEKGHTLSGFS